MVYWIIAVAEAVAPGVNWVGISAALGGVALLIGAAAAAYSTVIAANRIKEMAPVVADTHLKTLQIDNAVNNKPEGATTMVSQVQDLHNELPPKVDPAEDGAHLYSLVHEIYQWMKSQQQNEVG